MNLDDLEVIWKTLVDRCLKVINSFELEEICKRQGVNLDEECKTFFEVREVLKNKLADFQKVVESTQVKNGYFNNIQKYLYLRHLVENNELNPYYDLLSRITYYGGMTKPLVDSSEWEQIIKLIIDLNYIENELGYKDPLEPEIIYPREYHVGKDAAKLLKKGYKISVSNGRVHLNEESYIRLSRNIENKVKELGGLTVAEMLLQFLRKGAYNSNLRRYLIVRRQNSFVGKECAGPQIPFGYLLNICVKNPVRYTHKDFNEGLKELIELSRCFVSVLDIQEYQRYSEMYLDPNNFSDYMHKNIAFDSIIAIRQWNPFYVLELIRLMLLPWLEKLELKSKLNIVPSQLLQFISYFIGRQDKGVFISVTKAELYKVFSHIKKEHIDIMLNLFSHKKPINKDYTDPYSITDFGQKPLIYLRKKDRYLLMDQSWSAIAFYETLSQCIRHCYPDKFDSELGSHLEEVVKQLLDRKGIPYKDGYYDQDEECDLILETKNKVIFVEIKKKPLTRKAIAGSGVHQFNDLSKSLVSSQIQLGKHESKLRRDERIELRKHLNPKRCRGMQTQMVELDERIIERVSLSAWDYGFLNNSLIVTEILSLLTICDIQATNPDEDVILNDLRKMIQKLKKQYDDLNDIYGEQRDLKHTYFDCTFISLQQFMMILDDSNDVDSFIDALFRTKQVTTQSGDFYCEYYNLKEIGNK